MSDAIDSNSKLQNDPLDEPRSEALLEDMPTALEAMPRFDIDASDRLIAESLRALSERELRMKEEYDSVSSRLRDWISESFELERQRALTT